ncbi:MAG: 16S rRNA (adenine(1518)-N(6)/adenine(1519)-N(6))-dimethyltransferase RsmA [Patescibacteria group bacterium]
MQLTSQQTVAYLCKRYQLEPSRSSGQNFLVCDDVLMDIIAAANLTDGDTVLEIGAGFGTLTVELCSRAGAVIAVELERRLYGALRKLAAVHENLRLIEGDVFKHLSDIDSVVSDLGYTIVANVPYNITSLILRTFLERTPRPRELVLLVQREVAERIVAEPGEMSLLSVAVQLSGEPSMLRTVSRDCFWPVPAVDSAVLAIRGVGQDAHGYSRSLGPLSRADLYRVVKIGFSAKRKKLYNNIAAGFRIPKKDAENALLSAHINASARAQDLSIKSWIDLTKELYRKGGL